MEDVELGSLEMAVCLMFGAFTLHQNEDERLSKDKFMKVLDSELPNFTKDLDAADKEKIFKEVDTDCNQSVDFPEFVELISKFALASYEILKKMSKNLKKQ